MNDAVSVEVLLFFNQRGGLELREGEFWSQFGIPRYERIPNDPVHSREVPAEITAVDKKKELESIQRRILHRGLTGEIVASGHRGYLPGELVFGKPFPEVVHYEIFSATPEGDVRIAEKTKLSVGMKFRD